MCAAETRIWKRIRAILLKANHNSDFKLRIPQKKESEERKATILNKSKCGPNCLLYFNLQGEIHFLGGTRKPLNSHRKLGQTESFFHGLETFVPLTSPQRLFSLVLRLMELPVSLFALHPSLPVSLTLEEILKMVSVFFLSMKLFYNFVVF